ncbi:MAG: heme-binding protein [Planctomycetes bacterium]|nr:heme-binding protein [Planctomycetota bacterium]
MTEHLYHPEVEILEDRTAPALIVSQIAVAPPLLNTAEVSLLLQRAAAATTSDDAIVAIVDRGGNLLGVRVEGNVSTTITGNQQLLDFAIDGAIAKARTGAFFGNDQAPLTSRTIGFISQTTVTEREVNSNPNINNPNSTVRGPGFVAPIRVGGHFPPGVNNTPLVDLFGIEHTNRDSLLSPGPDHLKGTADDIPLAGRFNATFNAGQAVNPPLAYGEYLLTADRLANPIITAGNSPNLVNPAMNHYQARGIATLPGGIPLIENGVVVGGVGVFFPGATGFASEENSSLNSNYDPTKPDRTLEAEFIALAAAGGSQGAGFPVGTLNGVPPLSGFDIPFGNIELAGVSLDIIGPGGTQGPGNLVAYANANLGVGLGNPNSGVNEPLDGAAHTLLPGMQVPQGWLVGPTAGGNLSAADVQQIIQQAINEEQNVRAQIRLPNGTRTKFAFAVSDTNGNILGLYRTPDATVFSLDVAVSKARNLAYYDNPAQLQAVDQLAGFTAGISFTSRTFRYLANPRFPVGVGVQPGPFSILNDPGVNSQTGLNTGAPQPASAFQSVFGFDSFNPGSNFRDPFNPANQSGVIFFPGASPVYKTLGGQRVLVGGFGVSGDGVDEDDVTTFFGIKGFEPNNSLRVDNFGFNGVRLPYQKFNRNPEG